jgi:hypothetical protein
MKKYGFETCYVLFVKLYIYIHLTLSLTFSNLCFSAIAVVDFIIIYLFIF